MLLVGPASCNGQGELVATDSWHAEHGDRRNHAGLHWCRPGQGRMEGRLWTPCSPVGFAISTPTTPMLQPRTPESPPKAFVRQGIEAELGTALPDGCRDGGGRGCLEGHLLLSFALGSF